jgi:sodium/hydrogen antiporter
MVLCSITIHGLSIPGFSLGRRVHSVSRTWSRHAPPEWLNQARIVSRGAADIVINRDRDEQMERGEIKQDEKDIAELATQPSRRIGTPQKPDDGGSSGTTLEGQEQEDPPSSPTGEEGARPDTDGTDLVSEWQEGQQRVIERQTSPGEDVRYLYAVHRFFLTESFPIG